MNRAFKLLLITATLVISLSAVALAPLFTFGMLDAGFDKSAAMESVSHIDVDSSDIPLVQSVKQTLSVETETGFEESDFADMYSGMEELLHCGVLPSSVINSIAQVHGSELPAYSEVYKEKGDRTIGYRYYGKAGSMIECNYVSDRESGKVLSFVLYSTVGEAVDRQQALEAYIHYLGLDILDDWKYNGSRYYSEKADLYAAMEYDPNSKYYYIGIEL